MIHDDDLPPYEDDEERGWVSFLPALVFGGFVLIALASAPGVMFALGSLLIIGLVVVAIFVVTIDAACIRALRVISHIKGSDPGPAIRALLDRDGE